MTGNGHADVLWMSPFTNALNLIVNAGDGTFGNNPFAPVLSGPGDGSFALPGSATGQPIVLASGTPTAGQTLAFDLFHGAPSAAAALFVGISVS